LAQGRHHSLQLGEEPEAYRVTGVVAKPSVTTRVPELALQVWRRNRVTPLVGFRIDPKGRLLGEGFIPKAGLSPAEFLLWLRTIAAECDRFEHALTGTDME
jgi:hypothetical protein